MTTAVAAALSNISPQLHQRQCNSSDTTNAAVICMKCHAIDHQPGSQAVSCVDHEGEVYHVTLVIKKYESNLQSYS